MSSFLYFTIALGKQANLYEVENTMAGTFTATFEGPLDSYNPNFTLRNDLGAEVSTVAFSGKTAAFPITWDRIGDMKDNNVGDPTKPFLAGTRGEDEEIIYMYFYGFKSGTTLSFSNGDLDYTGDPSSVVPVSAIAGTRVLVFLNNGQPFTGEFKAVNGKMQAIIEM